MDGSMNILLVKENSQYTKSLYINLLKNPDINRVDRASSFSAFQKFTRYLQSYDVMLVDLVLE